MPDGKTYKTERTVTPVIESDTYQATITPTWTSRPITEEITKYTIVTPVIETETIKTVSTVTEIKTINGK
jgi:hypothetical protein